MDKHTIIVIGASVIIAGIVGYGLLNIYAANQIQFRVENQGNFRYFGFINEEKISICNPMPFYTSLNNLKIKMNFEGRDIGELNFPSQTISPNSEIILEGKFTTEAFEEVQYLSMHFDAMFMDTIPQRIDPSKMAIITEIQVQLIGIIPIVISNQYSALEFWEMMNSGTGYTC